jgi:hypothetical protein
MDPYKWVVEPKHKSWAVNSEEIDGWSLFSYSHIHDNTVTLDQNTSALKEAHCL